MAFIGTFQFRRDTAAVWAASNPVLLAGELAIETDTSKFKLGNGTTAWNALPYGGIKGDTGATGATGVAGATGAAGANGWSPILAVENDGERRVLRLVDWTGGTGTKPATGSYLGPTGFVATAAQATDIRGPQGATGVAPTQNTFATVTVGTSPTPTLLVADAAADVLTVNAGAGISLTADAATDALTIVNSDTGSAARAAHEAAAEPHPQYTTTAEAAAAAPVQSVDGRTGAVTFLQATRATEFASAANNNTVQAVHSLVVPTERITAGLTIEFEMWGTQTNVAISGGNNNVLLQVNGTTIATATVAVGTTAQNNRAWHARGALTFRSATQVVGSIQHMITGVLSTLGSNIAAPTTIAAGNTTVTLAVQTATANAGNSIRVGTAVIEEA